MIRRTVITSIVCLASAIIVRADILPPGHKSVSSIARFENLADYPDYVFFVSHHPHHDHTRHPEQTKDGDFDVGAQRLEPADPTTHLGGNPIRGGKYLLAVPKAKMEKSDGKVMASWFGDKASGMLFVAIPGGYRSVPESEKRSEFRFVYKVHIDTGTSESDKTLKLETISEDKPSSGSGEQSPSDPPAKDSSRWYIAGAVAGVALLLLVGWLVMRRRESATM
jgi:hypothetical protein